MALSEQQTREYAETLEEIAQLEYQLKVINGLGVSNSSNGISSTFRNPEEVTKRLTFLRRKRNILESLRDGRPVNYGPLNSFRANYWGGS